MMLVWRIDLCLRVLYFTLAVFGTPVKKMIVRMETRDYKKTRPLGIRSTVMGARVQKSFQTKK